jgi:hypothetical protein
MKRVTARRAAALALPVGVLALAGCGSSGPSASSLRQKLEAYGTVSALKVDGTTQCTEFNYWNSWDDSSSASPIEVDVCKSESDAKLDLQAAKETNSYMHNSGNWQTIAAPAPDASVRIGNVVIDKTADRDASAIRQVIGS